MVGAWSEEWGESDENKFKNETEKHKKWRKKQKEKRDRQKAKNDFDLGITNQIHVHCTDSTAVAATMP